MDAEPAVTALRERWQRVLDQIEVAACSAGRNPGEIRLVVVTKGHSLEAVQAARQAGMRVFGENYAEEGALKIQAFQADGWAAEWHMIGHIQSRKAGLVAGSFDQVHSLDSLKLARRLNRFAGEAGRRLPVLCECNVSGEETKFGWPGWDESEWPALAGALGEILMLERIELRGLMTMAPFFDAPDQARPYFERLRRLRDFLANQLQTVLPDLSMGMSGDFTAAIQEGATLVRIGTAIMGPRPGA